MKKQVLKEPLFEGIVNYHRKFFFDYETLKALKKYYDMIDVVFTLVDFY